MPYGKKTEGEKKLFSYYPSVSPMASHPLTAAVPFVATRHFPAPRGITPDKGSLGYSTN